MARRIAIKPTQPTNRPAYGVDRPAQIRVVVGGSSAFGRNLLRGAIQYVRRNAPPWRLQIEMKPEATRGPDWDHDDGTICAVADGPLVSRLAAEQHPIVNCLAHYEDLGIPTVCTDDLAIGRMAAEHFIERGFERFAFWASGERSLAARLRSQGFEQRVREHGLEFVGFVTEWPQDQRTARSIDWSTLTAALAPPHPPTALFVTHDTSARIAAGHLAGAQIPVPEHVALLGVDNDELQCEATFPPLSSIAVAYDQMGYEAARQLHRLLDGQPASPQPILFTPTGIVERQSTDIIAVDDPRICAAARYIRLHACTSCSVDDIANHLQVSRRWIETQFRKRFGRTPHTEMTRIRMARAVHLLRSTQLPIHEIAEQCGYPLLRNFGRAFKQTIGDTPASYRAAHAPQSRGGISP